MTENLVKDEVSGLPKDKLLASILIGLSSFFLLAGYEFVRGVVKPLFISFYGKENLPFVMMFIPPATFLLIYLYGLLLNVFGSKKTLIITTLISGAVMVVCQIFIEQKNGIASAILFLFRSAYIVILIEQFWSFINSILTPKQAVKVNAIVLALSTLGGIIGGLVVSQTVQDMGSTNAISIAAILMIPTAIAGWFAYKVGGEPVPEKKEKSWDPSGAKMVITSAYLRKIALVIFFSQILAGVLDLKLWDFIGNAITNTDAQSKYYSLLYVYINSFSLLNQLIIIPFLGYLLSRKCISLCGILRTVPIMNLLAAIYLIFFPSLFSASVVLVVFKAQDYSFFRASKEPLYIPLPYDERYRSKQVIDSFVYRLAKGGFGGIMSLFTKMTSKVFVAASYSYLAFGISAIWFLVVNMLGKEYEKKMKDIGEKEM